MDNPDQETSSSDERPLNNRQKALNEVNPTRRRIVAAVGVIGAATAAARSGIIGNAAYDALISALNGLSRDWQKITLREDTRFANRYPDNARPAKMLFGDRGEMLKIVGGRAHYQYGNLMHPDDQWACEAVVAYAHQLSQEHQYDPMLMDMSPQGSYLCLGGPVSNAATRAFLEYGYINENKPDLGLKRRTDPTIRLPMEFTLSRELINKSASQKLHRTDHNRYVPNWGVRLPDGQMRFPNTEDRKSDFLLISRIPNWREGRPRFTDFKDTVTIFSSTHGVGTSAVRLLLDGSHQELLKSILLKTSNMEYWQVLLTINSMKDDFHPHSEKKRLVAHGISPSILCEEVAI